MFKKAMKEGFGFTFGGLAVIALLAGCLTNSGNSVTAPSISGQPVNDTVDIGGTATFSVDASGDSLTYEWLNGSTILSDTSGISGSSTNTLTISNVAASDGGAQFSCIVKNSAGSQTSYPALLLVNVPVTTKSLTAGDQGNADHGSFLDIDNMTDYLSSEVTTLDNSADIDLFFGYGSSGSAIYSPDVAAGSNGFPIAQSTLTTANITQIRLAAGADFNSITNKAQIDALWAASAANDVGGKLVITNGTTFMAESNLGLIVLIQVSSLTPGPGGTVVLTGVSKF